MSLDLGTRARGALLGVAVGNALGLEVEGWSPEQIRRRYPAGVTEVDERERSRLWDDDLAQTVVLAEALLAGERLDVGDLVDRLATWMQENGRGIGLLTARVLTEAIRGGSSREAAFTVWHREGGTAAGNGAVMRCIPVALRWGHERERMWSEAATSALATHHDPRCVWSTVAAVDLVASCLEGASPDPPDLAGRLGSRGAPPEVTGAILAVAEAPNLERLELAGPSAGYTVKTMQVAVWCLMQDGGFEPTLVEVVNAGGDTDTNGAVVGGLMGARLGPDAIPRPWLDRIAGVQRLTELADRLVRARRR